MLVGKVTSNSFNGELAFATPDSRTMAKAALDNLGLGRCVMTPFVAGGFFPYPARVSRTEIDVGCYGYCDKGRSGGKIEEILIVRWCAFE